ncbi:MAG: hypothetical protein AAF517_14740, partial [Planctomycetota bacterium]
MNNSPTAGLRPLSSLYTGLLGVAFFASVGFFVGFAAPYLLLDSSKLERFAGREVWILTHIASGAVAMLIGPFQLWLKKMLNARKRRAVIQTDRRRNR